MSKRSRRNNRRIRKQGGQPLDANISAGLPKPSPNQTAGAPGTAVYGGQVVNNEKDTRLQGSERYTSYSDMLANTAIVAAGVRFFINMVSKAGWHAEPADDSAEAEEKAELVTDMMHDMLTPWHRVVRRAAMYCFWGFSVQEWTAKVREEDGVIGFLDIEPRAQKTIEKWDLDVHGRVLGVVQRNPQDGEEIYLPREKIVYTVDDTLNDSPEGLGLFRHLIKIATRLERYELLESWGFETDLRGMPVARGPFTAMEEMISNGTLTRAQVTALQQPMLDFIESHNRNPELGMVLDSATYSTADERNAPSAVRQWDVEILQGEPQGQKEVAAAIERLNREMARVLGVEQMLLGGDSTGSFALAKDKSQSLGLIIDSCLQSVRETMEKDLLTPIWQLNNWDPKLKPTFVIERVQYREIEQVVNSLETLARAGAPLAPNDPAINEIRELIGLTEADEIDLSDPDMALLLLGKQPPGEDNNPGEDPSADPSDPNDTEDSGD
jgi:hypothetical protein